MTGNGYVEAPPLPTAFTPPPELDLSGESTVPLPYAGNAKLYYWDTGGDGEPIVLQHAGTGNTFFWGYQQQAFADAGYRTIAFSRRGHRGSDPGPVDEHGRATEASGTPNDDLITLVDHLGVDKFHILGTAAGGGCANEFCTEYPDRILSLVLVAALANIEEPDWDQSLGSLRVSGRSSEVGSFNSNPAEFRELGPSYRWANPEGVTAWLEIEHSSQPVSVSHTNTRYSDAALTTWAKIAARTFPTLLITGDADLYVPPSMYRHLATKVPNSELSIVPEAGHSVFWEQPETFNQLVLSFLDRHSS